MYRTIPVRGDAEVAATVTADADAGVIVGGDDSPEIGTRAAAVAGMVAGGVPDRAFGTGASSDAHGSTTKTRRRELADAGMITGGVPDRAFGTGASTDAHGSATKKRRRQSSLVAARATQKHCRRMIEVGAARGKAPTPYPGHVEGRPAEDWAEW